MNISIELFAKVYGYVSGQLRLAALEEWVAPRLPVLLAQPDTSAGQLTGAVELCLAEFKEGIRSERSVRAMLKRFISPQVLLMTEPITEPAGETVTIPGNQFLQALFAMPSQTPENQSPTWSIEPQGVFA